MKRYKLWFNTGLQINMSSSVIKRGERTGLIAMICVRHIVQYTFTTRTKNMKRGV